MPALNQGGYRLKRRSPPSIEKRTRGVLKDYTVHGTKRSVQGTPRQAVNRTNKTDKYGETFYKNVKDPADDARAFPRKRRRGSA